MFVHVPNPIWLLFNGQAFHASVEVKGSEEVTVESLLQRVLPFFVVDKEEYSVQWSLDTLLGPCGWE